MSPKLKTCRTSGCGLQFHASRHRHCCKPCSETNGAVHSSRCGSVQRALIRAEILPRVYDHICTVRNCSRKVARGFRACCSFCDGSGYHSRRCDRESGPTAQASAWTGLLPAYDQMDSNKHEQDTPTESTHGGASGSNSAVRSTDLIEHSAETAAELGDGCSEAFDLLALD